MKKIQVLDCTLRDGGRVINCNFRDNIIRNISKKLEDSHIDIIEMGFIRDEVCINYNGNSTFFTAINQIEPFISERKGKDTSFVAFIDYGMYDFSKLETCSGLSVDGIRVGFTKKDYENHKKDICNCLLSVKEKGYKLFVQGVNSLAYSDIEFLELIQFVNQINPYSFGIVDTYGAMYIEDAKRVFDLTEHNLNSQICIDVHLHNNFQLAFAIAQELVQRVKNDRKMIIDATLEGMGKCAGNLNTELIIDYLNRMCNGNYETDMILDIIDEYIMPIKRKVNWGYTVPAFIAGIYKAHPNNVIWMTEKNMEMKEIRHVMANINEEVRQRYDYNNIEKTYIQYVTNKIDDSKTIKKLQEMIGKREVLVMAPGNNLVRYCDDINDYIQKNNPFIISVNYVVENQSAYCFVGYKKRYGIIKKETERFILPSNIKKTAEGDKEYIVNYESILDLGYKLFDNSTMMLLNLLKKLEVEKITIAGFDGFYKDKDNNFVNMSFDNERHMNNYDGINEEISKMVREYRKRVKKQIDVQFLTPSMYCEESILG